MANFLITSPNSLAQGTDTTDLFVLNTAVGATVYGNGGADQISAAGVINPTNGKFYGGAGGDSVYLTAGAANGAVAGFFLGNGADLMVASAATLANSTVIGGGANDTIDLIAGVFTDTNINGNAGSDRISASGSTFTRGFVAGGGDADRIVLNAIAAADASTVNGGGGADVLTLSGGNFSGGRIDADTLNDSQFFGNDTVTLNTTLTGSFVQLGGGGDRLVQNGAVGTGATIEGGAGLDSISLGTLVTTGNVFVGGGAGVDTIAVSAGLAAVFGTIQGGGGADVINVSGAAGSAGAIMGGAAGDAIGLGTNSAIWGSGAGLAANANFSGVAVSYQSFDQSNLDGLDVISAATQGAAASTGAAFMLTQSAVNFTAVGAGTFGVAGNQFNVGVNGRVTGFTNAGTTTLTQRATLLDANLTQGQAVLFQAGGTNYLFVQGGAAGSGVSNDLIAQLNVGGFIATGAAGGTGGLFITNNSAIKINYTDVAAF